MGKTYHFRISQIGILLLKKKLRVIGLRLLGLRQKEVLKEKKLWGIQEVIKEIKL